MKWGEGRTAEYEIEYLALDALELEMDELRSKSKKD
jgi:hypothetical protein